MLAFPSPEEGWRAALANFPSPKPDNLTMTLGNAVPMQLASSKVIVLSSIEIHCWPRSRGLSAAGSIDAVFGEVHYSPVAIWGGGGD